MKLRLECYEYEKDAALAALGTAANIASVSKGYPDARQTGTAGTPCTYRYYIDLDGREPFRSGAGPAEAAAMAALRLFAALPMDAATADYAVASLRGLYGAAAGLSAAQLLELLSELYLSVLSRTFPNMNASGRRAG